MHQLSFYSRFIAAVTMAVVIAGCGVEQDGRTASELLSRVQERYATAVVYRDRGTLFSGKPDFWAVVHSISGNDGERPFATDFDRSRNLLRFSLPPTVLEGTADQLRQQLIDASAPTASVSTFVPLLLLGDGTRGRLRSGIPFRRLPDERVGGHRCHVLAFTDQAKVETLMFIDSGTFTIRRIRRVLPIAGGSGRTIERTIDYSSVEIR